MGGGFRLDYRQRSSDNLHALFSIFSGYLGMRRAIIELCRTDEPRHFVIIECRYLAKGCALKCGCMGLMFFRYLSCLDTIISYTNSIGIVPVYACNVCDALVASCATTG